MDKISAPAKPPQPSQATRFSLTSPGPPQHPKPAPPACRPLFRIAPETPPSKTIPAPSPSLPLLPCIPSVDSLFAPLQAHFVRQISKTHLCGVPTSAVQISGHSFANPFLCQKAAPPFSPLSPFSANPSGPSAHPPQHLPPQSPLFTNRSIWISKTHLCVLQISAVQISGHSFANPFLCQNAAPPLCPSQVTSLKDSANGAIPGSVPASSMSVLCVSDEWFKILVCGAPPHPLLLPSIPCVPCATPVLQQPAITHRPRKILLLIFVGLTLQTHAPVPVSMEACSTANNMQVIAESDTKTQPQPACRIAESDTQVRLDILQKRTSSA